MQNAFATDPNNPGFVDRFFEHTKSCGMGRRLAHQQRMA